MLADLAPRVGVVRENARVASKGKRAGARRAARPRRRLEPRILGIAAAITACLLAWAYLVYAAIDFGATARGGDSGAWAFLGLAALGAVACLFLGLMLVARALRMLGITSPPPARTAAPEEDAPSLASTVALETPRPAGGRRAAR